MASTRGLLRAGRQLSELAGAQRAKAADRALTHAHAQAMPCLHFAQQIRGQTSLTVQGHESRVASVTKSLLVDTLDLVRKLWA